MQYQSTAINPDRISLMVQPAVIQIMVLCLTGTDLVNIIPQNFQVLRIHKCPVSSPCMIKMISRKAETLYCLRGYHIIVFFQIQHV